MSRTTNRVQVGLSDRSFQVVCELADLRGVSRSAVIAEIIEQGVVPLEKTAKVLRVARDHLEGLHSGYRHVLDGVRADVEALTASALDQLDWVAEQGDE